MSKKYLTQLEKLTEKVSCEHDEKCPTWFLREAAIIMLSQIINRCKNYKINELQIPDDLYSNVLIKTSFLSILLSNGLHDHLKLIRKDFLFYYAADREEDYTGENRELLDSFWDVLESYSHIFKIAYLKKLDFEESHEYYQRIAEFVVNSDMKDIEAIESEFHEIDPSEMALDFLDDCYDVANNEHASKAFLRQVMISCGTNSPTIEDLQKLLARLIAEHH